MTVKEKQIIRRRLEFKARVGKLLNDTSLSYVEIGQMVNRTHQRVAQIRRELGRPRRHGGYRHQPSALDLLSEQETKQ